MIYFRANTKIRIVSLLSLLFFSQSQAPLSYANSEVENKYLESKLSSSVVSGSNSTQIVSVVKLNSGKLAVIKESVSGSVTRRIELLKTRSGILTSARTVSLHALGSPDPARNQQWHLNRLEVEKIPVKNSLPTLSGTPTFLVEVCY